MFKSKRMMLWRGDKAASSINMLKAINKFFCLCLGIDQHINCQVVGQTVRQLNPKVQLPINVLYSNDKNSQPEQARAPEPAGTTKSATTLRFGKI